MASLNLEIEYQPGLLVQTMIVLRRLGVRFGPRFVAWAMQRSGHVRLGNGPWLRVRPNLQLRGGR